MWPSSKCIPRPLTVKDRRVLSRTKPCIPHRFFVNQCPVESCVYSKNNARWRGESTATDRQIGGLNTSGLGCWGQRRRNRGASYATSLKSISVEGAWVLCYVEPASLTRRPQLAQEGRGLVLPVVTAIWLASDLTLANESG